MPHVTRTTNRRRQRIC